MEPPPGMPPSYSGARERGVRTSSTGQVDTSALRGRASEERGERERTFATSTAVSPILRDSALRRMGERHVHVGKVRWFHSRVGVGISVKSAQRHHFHVHGNGGARWDFRTEIGHPLASSPIRVPEALKDIRRCRPARRRWEDRGQWPNHSVTRDMIALSKASSE